MTRHIDDTHREDLTSWVESATDPATDFPIQNLPFGVFRGPGADRPHIGVAIGDQILDLALCRYKRLLIDLPSDLQRACVAETLNPLMALRRRHWRELRRLVSALLSEASMEEYVRACLVSQSDATMLLPVEIGDYTDFYASVHHATNVGALFRPDNPLLPNYKHVPIGYHGRSSSIVVSGSDVVRPKGQLKGPDDDAPSYGPCRLLDYELEVGFFAGGPLNALGQTIPLEKAENRIFGVCLVNDWSARDIQAWEYQPLGPFLGKSFLTSVSPWIVTLDALAPYREALPARPEGDPQPLPYLTEGHPEKGGLALDLEVQLTTRKMRSEGLEPVTLSRGSFLDMYWSMAQMLTHHASNGCNLGAGDLMASGTVSGPEPGTYGSMLEITRRGAEPLELPTGEVRRMLDDGDEVTLRGSCARDGFARIGFGVCRGRITPAR